MQMPALPISIYLFTARHQYLDIPRWLNGHVQKELSELPNMALLSIHLDFAPMCRIAWAPLGQYLPCTGDRQAKIGQSDPVIR